VRSGPAFSCQSSAFSGRDSDLTNDSLVQPTAWLTSWLTLSCSDGCPSHDTSTGDVIGSHLMASARPHGPVGGALLMHGRVEKWGRAQHGKALKPLTRIPNLDLGADAAWFCWPRVARLASPSARNCRARTLSQQLLWDRSR
jgi:hypothetical protein